MAAADGRDDHDEGAPSGRDDPAPPPVPDLRAAVRTARADEAERSRAIADLRGVALARLEVLKDRLAPVLDQIPADVDLFDAAVMPGPTPRLFIDMIGFIEMAHDRRRYRFVQDRRDGRVILCESDRPELIVEAVTAYIARRLIEREKALASAGGGDGAAIEPATVPRSEGLLRRTGRLVLEYLGLAALVVLVWVLGRALYRWAVGL